MYRPKRKGEKVVLKEYENGITSAKLLAEKTKYSIWTVYTYLSKLGITNKRNVEYKGANISERTKKIIELLEKGISQIEIAKMVGVQSARVYTVKKEYNL